MLYEQKEEEKMYYLLESCSVDKIHCLSKYDQLSLDYWCLLYQHVLRIIVKLYSVGIIVTWSKRKENAELTIYCITIIANHIIRWNKTWKLCLAINFVFYLKQTKRTCNGIHFTHLQICIGIIKIKFFFLNNWNKTQKRKKKFVSIPKIQLKGGNNPISLNFTLETMCSAQYTET